MKNIYKLFVLLCIVTVSCNNDDENVTSDSGVLKISGTVFSPNGNFPISRAHVKIFKDDVLIASQTTSAIGTFEITGLPEAMLEVQLSKGKFMKEFSVDLREDYDLQLTEGELDIFPSIAVVTGSYDNIEQVLVGIGVVNPLTNEPAFDIINGSSSGNRAAHFHGPRDGQVAGRSTSLPSNVDFNFNDLLHDSDLLDNYDIIFLNCGATDAFDDDTIATTNLKNYISNGGIVYATDWMYSYIQSMFDAEDYLTFATPERAGSGDPINAQVFNADLEAWLANQGIVVSPSVLVDNFLGGWQMVDTFDSDNVTNWLLAEDFTYSGNVASGKSLAFTFQYNQGGVFYSSFHTHGGGSDEDDAVLQMMNYFVFELSGL
ncbi:MAG: carboxypeptidase regulatory-like domain-containing protein [Flavobacterium sp.]|nr:carboxypeptidase regulatory-like domain-containing protein [Flavobacterium sp.]